MYSKKYEVDLGNHPFITKKYKLIKEKLENEFRELQFIEPTPAQPDVLLKVHTNEYVTKVLNLALTTEEILRLEIPLTKEIIEASLICVNGTIQAAELALEQKVGIHIGGGFHHAFADHGEGFCVFNDIACAVKILQENYKIDKIAVVDCDVHQGNGTAKIFEQDKNVFTFSIHQAEIYPYPKQKSTLDIEVKAYTQDEEYLKLLKYGLSKVKEFNPEVIFYQAGVDIYLSDQLAQLSITKTGIQKRDQLIKQFFIDKPIVLTLGGGYAFNLEDTVDLHYNTIKIFLT
ncbi:MAG: histone deacetylase [Elusimicrobiota bacterium]|nr:histone deacetylase [Elusimicrobiota bacterium]